MIPAFCIGDGYGGATLMSVVRSLGRARIPVWVFSHRQDSPARYSRYCKFVPAPAAAKDPDALERVLLEHAGLQRERPVLFVISDTEAEFVADRLTRLRQYFRINSPGPQLMHGLVDKRQQYRAVDRLGIPMPETYHDVTSQTVRSGVFQFPLVIKPAISSRWPAGRLKGLTVENAAQLEQQLRELEQAGAPVVVQSIVPGPASHLYNVIICMSQAGEPLAWGTYRKVRQYPPDFGLSAVVETVRVPAVEESALRLSRALNFTGICGVEFKQDPRDGVFRFVEINPRSQLANSVLALAGADVAFAMYADLTGGVSPPQEPIRTGVKWMALNLERKACRDLRAQGQFSWRSWARSVRGVRVEALLAWDDPVPGLAAYFRVLRNVLMGRSGRTAAPGILRPEESGR